MLKNTCNVCGANLIHKDGRWVCPACGAYKEEEISNLVSIVVLGAVVWRGISCYRKTSLSYRAVSGGYEVYCDSDYECGAMLTIPATHKGKNVVAIALSGFKNRTEIEFVVLPDTIRTIGSNAFSGCTQLARISFSDGLEKIGDGAFSGTAVETIELPGSIRSIGKNAFSGCARLTRISFSDGLEKIEDGAFSGTAIETIELPGSIRSIGKNAFFGCTYLAYLTVTSGLQRIGAGAFSDTGLVTLFLPETVNMVGDNAFGNCAKLRVIKIAQDNEIPLTWAETWNNKTTAEIIFVYRCTLDYTSADESQSRTIYFDPTSVPVFPIPERQGYSFTGWFNGETTVSDPAGKPVSADIVNCHCTLTPGWEPKENQITFNSNGGKGTMRQQAVLSDHAEKLSTNQFFQRRVLFPRLVD